MFSSGSPQSKGRSRFLQGIHSSRPEAPSNSYQVLAEDGAMGDTSVKLSDLFTPSVGAKWRSSVTGKMAALEEKDKDLATIFKVILKEPEDTTQQYPLPDQTAQSKLTQAMHTGINSLKLDREAVQSNPDAAITQIISMVSDVYSATPNNLVRSLIQGDFTTGPWARELLRHVAVNIRTKAHALLQDSGSRKFTSLRQAMLDKMPSPDLPLCYLTLWLDQNHSVSPHTSSGSRASPGDVRRPR